MGTVMSSDDENDTTQGIKLSREFMEEFRAKRKCENTVICQVLIPCMEEFWVKDNETGEIVQGSLEKRAVLHLVRLEQVTKTHIIDGSRLFPFRQELGQWQITDI